MSSSILVRRFLPALAIFSLLFAHNLEAQQNSSRLTGTITDASGSPVVGARIEARQESRTIARKSQADGGYALDLAAGRWNIRVSYPGFGEAVGEVNFGSGGESVTRSFTLQPTDVSETVTVSGVAASYQSTVASSLGMELDVRELPAVINTVTAALLADTTSRRLRDVIDYIPGVNGTETNGGTGDQVTIRGFTNNSRKVLNGLRLNSFTVDQTQNFANIERIEVLKGPASVQFGADEPGGSINFITKKPLPNSFYSIAGDFGSYGYRGGEFDATGKLTPGGKLLYRFIVAGNKADSFRDTLNLDRFLIAPSIQLRYGSSNSLLVEVENQNMDQPYDRGTFYLEGAGLKNNFAPISRSVHEPSDFLRSNYSRGSLYWNHAIGEQATLRVNGTYIRNMRVSEGVRNPNLNPLYVPGTNRFSGNPLVARTSTTFIGGGDAYMLRPEITLRWRSGSLRHTSMFGVSTWNAWSSQDGRDGFDAWPIHALAPVYNTAPMLRPLPNPTDPRILPAGARDFISRGREQEHGAFYQHKIDIGQRLHVLGGARFDSYSNDQAFANNRFLTPNPPLSGFTDRLTSWRLGATYDVVGPLSIFGGYSNSFVPQSGRDRSGNRFEALAARNFEGGARMAFYNNRLRVTASAFQIEQDNITQPDPDNLPGEFFALPLGSNRVRGTELEVTGSLVRGWDIVGGFTTLDAIISKNLTGLQGNVFFNTPRAQTHAWNRFNLERFGLKGLTAGYGLIYTSERQGNNQNNFVLPSFFRSDAAVFYQLGKAEFRLTIVNLFNETYYIGSQNRAQNIAPGAPRLINGGIRFVF